MPPGSLIRFGTFELDLDTGEIRKQGRKLKLAPQPFQVLALLARNPGQLVTRETLRTQLWGRDALVDFEHGLNFCIRQIRSALGESASRPRFIETLPRRGYRLILPANGRYGKRSAAVTSVPTRNRSSATTTVARVATVSDDDTMSVVVLEFENLSRDESSDWLSTGLAETLTADLRGLRSVHVASRDSTSAMMRQMNNAAARDAGTDYLELGRQMGADWIITGSYQQVGGRLRITTQLLDVRSGEITAVGKTDGTWDEIFEVQDRVASSLIEALKLTDDAATLERSVVPETRLLEAYEQCSLGRRGLYRMGKGTLEDALQHFESALALDPDYAMAHSGLGSTHAMRFIHTTNPQDLRVARAHLERARDLDPELAEPYPWLCYVYIREGRLHEALQMGERGVYLLPDLVHAQYFLAAVYLALCETTPVYWQRAANHMREATTIDPRWQAAWWALAVIALFNGNYEGAEQFAHHLLRLNSNETGALRFIGAEVVLGTVEQRRGNFEGATRWFTESLTTHGRSAHVYRDLTCTMSSCGLGDSHLRYGSADLALTHYRRAWQSVQEAPTMLAHERAGTRALAGLAAAHAAKGELERARELLSQALQWLANARQAIHITPVAWLAELLYTIAVAQVRVQRTSDALDTLEQALGAGWHDADWLERDPEMRPLLREPRFVGFIEQVRRLPTVEIATPDLTAR